MFVQRSQHGNHKTFLSETVWRILSAMGYCFLVAAVVVAMVFSILAWQDSNKKTKIILGESDTSALLTELSDKLGVQQSQAQQQYGLILDKLRQVDVDILKNNGKNPNSGTTTTTTDCKNAVSPDLCLAEQEWSLMLQTIPKNSYSTEEYALAEKELVLSSGEPLLVKKFGGATGVNVHSGNAYIDTFSSSVSKFATVEDESGFTVNGITEEQFMTLYRRSVVDVLGLDKPGNGNNNNKKRDRPISADFAVDFDNDGIDDYAVIHMPESLVFPEIPANSWDIAAGTSIVYTPTGASTYSISGSLGAVLDPMIGAIIGGLGDDDFAFEFLGHSFSFNGTVYNDIFVGSDGYVSFGAAESGSGLRTLTRFSGSVPRIGVLFADLDPTCNDGVYYFTDASKTVITYNDVAHFPREADEAVCPVSVTSTAQIILYVNSTIELRYGTTDAAYIGTAIVNTEAVVGITAGNFASPVFVDHAAVANGAVVAVTIGTPAESFSNVAIPPGSTLEAIGTTFYKTFPDLFDILSIYSTGWNNLGTDIFGDRDRVGPLGRCCFQEVIQSFTGGIGLGPVLYSGQFGSNISEVQSFLYMSPLEDYYNVDSEGAYAPRIAKFYNWYPEFGGPFAPEFDGQWRHPAQQRSGGFVLLLDTEGAKDPYYMLTKKSKFMTNTMFVSEYSVYTQEFGHTWLYFAGFKHPNATKESTSFFDLLGRGLAHRTTWMHSGLRKSQHNFPGRFGETGGAPRSDTEDGIFLRQIVRDPQNPLLFRDVDDPSAAFPDTSNFLLNQMVTSCAALGLGETFFVTAADFFVEGYDPLSQVLMGVRSVESLTPEENLMWYVDEPRSPFAVTGFDPDLEGLRGVMLLTGRQNAAFCGSRVDFNISDNVIAIQDTAASVLGLPGFIANFIFGPRQPKIGDEADELDAAIVAANPVLQQRVIDLKLAVNPIVNDPSCTATSIPDILNPARENAVCVDVATIATIVVLPPGEEMSAKARTTMANIIKAHRKQLNGDAVDGHGARGRCFQIGFEDTHFPIYGTKNDGIECTEDYIPKFDVSLEPMIH